MSERYLEILEFRHIVKHMTFVGEGEKLRNKTLKNYVTVKVVLDMVLGNTTE